MKCTLKKERKRMNIIYIFIKKSGVKMHIHTLLILLINSLAVILSIIKKKLEQILSLSIILKAILIRKAERSNNMLMMKDSLLLNELSFFLNFNSIKIDI